MDRTKRKKVQKHVIVDLACELFSDKTTALLVAKYMYTAMLYNLLWKGVHIANGGCTFYEKRLYDPNIDSSISEYSENTFFWTPKHIGGGIGVDVYEVPESFDEFETIYSGRSIDISITSHRTSKELEFNNYDTSPFMYDSESQRLPKTVLQADSVYDRNMMRLYSITFNSNSNGKVVRNNEKSVN